MPRQSTTDLTTLEQRLQKLQRRIRARKADDKKQARADDARMKIIAGALALEHFAKNPDTEFGKIMFRLIDEYARPEDRVLFAFLPPREEPKPDLTEAAAE
jgi:hypothetical protein